MRLPITSRKMHRSLTNSPPSPRRQSPSTGSGTVSEADEKGSPESHRTCERPPLFSFCPASDLTYPRSVHSSGRMVHSSLTVSQVPLTRARQNALISSLFVPRHRPQRWTSNVMVTTMGNERKGCRIGPLLRAVVEEVTRSCEGP